MIALAWSMLREHRTTYIGVFAVIMFASLVLSASASALWGVSHHDGLSSDWMGHTQAQIQNARNQLSGSVAFLTTTLVVTGLVMLFMVASSMAFAVTERRRELALLRLTGASAGQCQRLTLAEAFTVGAVGTAAGNIFGALLATPLVVLLTRLGLAPSGIVVVLRPSVLGVSFLIGMAATLGGATAATQSITRINPVEAIGATGAAARVMTLTRWIVASFGAAIVVAVLLLPVGTGDFQTITLLITFVGILSLTAFAPVLVPTLARILGALGALAAPASGLIAQTHARWASRRTAALAIPVLVLMGICAPLFMIAQTSLALSQSRYGQAVRANLIIERDGAPLSTADVASLAALPGLATATRMTTAAGWAFGAGADRDAWVSWVDPARIGSVVDVHVLDGDLSDVDGDVVATTMSHVHVGQVVTLTTPDGKRIRVTIGAVLAGNSVLQAEVLAAPSFAHAYQASDKLVQSQTWATLSGHANLSHVREEIAHALPGTTAITKAQWLAEGTISQQQQQIKGILTLLGAGVLLATFALVQTTLSSLRERRDEFRLLRSLGTTPRQIHATVLLETTVVLVTAGVLVCTLLVITYVRLEQMLSLMSEATSPVVPIPLLAALFAGCSLITLAAAFGGTAWSLRTPRDRYPGLRA